MSGTGAWAAPRTSAGVRQDFSRVLARYAIGLAPTDVIGERARFLLPVVAAAASNSPLQGQSKSGGAWSRGGRERGAAL